MTNPFKYIYWRWWCMWNDVCFKHRLPKKWEYRTGIMFPKCKLCYDDWYNSLGAWGIRRAEEYNRKYQEFQKLP